MSDLNITNQYGIRLSDIQPGDVVTLDAGIRGVFEYVETTHYDRGSYRLWGYWGGKTYKQFGRFESISKHEPQFTTYDPTQVGDREDDI